MDNIKSMVEDSLREEGIRNVEVRHHSDPAKMRETIEIRSYTGGELFGYNIHISDAIRLEFDDIQKYIAGEVADAARYFNDQLTDRIEWGEKCVQFDLVRDNKATCFRCGAEVSLSDLNSFEFGMAETAVPNPPTNGYQSLPDIKKQMVLLALLRDACEPFCPNSPHDASYNRKL